MRNHEHEPPSADLDVLRAVVDVLVIGEPFLLSLWQDSGLTLTQIRVLRAIERTRPCAIDLAHALDLPPSSLSRVLERLEQRGLALRAVDRADRRRIVISITEAGSAFLGTLPALDRSAVGRAVRDVGPEERAALIRGAAALVAASRGHPPVIEGEGARERSTATTKTKANDTKGEAHVVPGS